jgi:hypothetical protein
MATFELDPGRWVPDGFQIIDGGATRLPRTFYSPAIPPQRRHDEYCIGIVEPPQPPEDEQFWKHQVRNFIEQNLNRIVEDA